MSSTDNLMETTQGGFVAGVRHALQGFSLISKPGIRGFVVIPLVINIVLFAGAIFGVSSNCIDQFE